MITCCRISDFFSDTAKLLISKGADVCRRNAIGHTPLMCVRYIRRSDFEMMGLLVEVHIQY